MPGTPTCVTKGRIIRAADRILSNPDRELRQRLLDDLKDTSLQRLSQVAVKSGAIEERERPHADVDWFGRGSGWWPEVENKEEKMRCAYIFAETLALGERGPARPIRSYWVSGIPDTFHVYVCDSDADGQQGEVNVIWVTPPIPPGEQEAPQPRDRAPHDLWVFADRRAIDAIRANYPSGYPTDEPVECAEGVYRFRADGW